MRPAARALAAATAAPLLAVGACSSGPKPEPAARAFLLAWARGDTAAAGRATDAPAQASAALSSTRARLAVAAGADLRLGAVRSSGDEASARYTAALPLRALGTWRYDGTLGLRKAGGRWLVHWTPTVLHPQLGAGEALARTRILPARAAILDAGGEPLTRPTPVVTVSIVPGELKDRAAALALLARTLGVDAGRIAGAVAAAGPTQLVPVITLRETDYAKVRSRIHRVPGLRFPTSVQQLAPSATFARQVLGRIGPATAEALAAAGSRYEAGDVLGLNGLQAAFQARLAGTAAGSVVLRDATGAVRATLATFPGTAGQPVRTTLDRRLQTAAEAALAATGKPAALVAVRPSTGGVLAAASTPADSSFNRAFAGRYPPGSTFKVVTTAALLSRGLRPDDPVPCPPTRSVEGKVFRNFEGEAAGRVPFRRDFAISCNTAFVGLAEGLPNDALPAAARRLGIGAPWTLPIGAYPGSVPLPASTVDRAAAAIGQGRVTVSPLGMALVAAAVADGTWRPPVLAAAGPSGTGPYGDASAAGPSGDAPPSGPSGDAPASGPASPAPSSAAPSGTGASSTGSAPAAVGPVPLPEAPQLRALMRAVVTEGTAAPAFRGYSGPPVDGKTGTAEFGTGRPPREHAWFVGFQPGRDLAFAVLVEGGGAGGAVAAPLAVRFLQRVP